jgi:hypothetical protein
MRPDNETLAELRRNFTAAAMGRSDARRNAY